MKRLCGLVLALLLAASPAYADFDEGVAAYDRGDYATALREFRPLAEQGDAGAQSYLGSMYLKGKGVPEDHAEAVTWYRKAAEQGNAIAQMNLGSMYAKGKGVAQDFVEAVKWYRAAAELGNADALTNLGVMYSNGYGVPQDYVLAHMWFNLAAGRGDYEAAVFREETAEHMTAKQITEAQRLAREWKPTK
jgi:TPR repeat protein